MVRWLLCRVDAGKGLPPQSLRAAHVHDPSSHSASEWCVRDQSEKTRRARRPLPGAPPTGRAQRARRQGCTGMPLPQQNTPHPGNKTAGRGPSTPGGGAGRGGQAGSQALVPPPRWSPVQRQPRRTPPHEHTPRIISALSTNACNAQTGHQISPPTKGVGWPAAATAPSAHTAAPEVVGTALPPPPCPLRSLCHAARRQPRPLPACCVLRCAQGRHAGGRACPRPATGQPPTRSLSRGGPPPGSCCAA